MSDPDPRLYKGTTHCDICPFLNQANCNLDPNTRPTTELYPPPDDCRLRLAPVTVMLRERARCAATLFDLKCEHIEGHESFNDILRDEKPFKRHQAKLDNGTVVHWTKDAEDDS